MPRYRTHPVQQIRPSGVARYQASMDRQYESRQQLIDSRRAQKAEREQRRRLDQQRQDVLDREQRQFGQQRQMAQMEYGFDRGLLADRFGLAEQAADTAAGRMATRDEAQFGRERTLQGDRAYYNSLSLQERAEIDRVAQQAGFANGFEMMAAQADYTAQDRQQVAGIASQAAEMGAYYDSLSIQEQAEIKRQAAEKGYANAQEMMIDQFLLKERGADSTAMRQAGRDERVFGQQRQMAGEEFGYEVEMGQISQQHAIDLKELGFDQEMVQFDMEARIAFGSQEMAGLMALNKQYEDRKAANTWIADDEKIAKIHKDMSKATHNRDLDAGQLLQLRTDGLRQIAEINQAGRRPTASEMPLSMEDDWAENVRTDETTGRHWQRSTNEKTGERSWERLRGDTDIKEVHSDTGYDPGKLTDKLFDLEKERRAFVSSLRAETKPGPIDPLAGETTVPRWSDEEIKLQTEQQFGKQFALLGVPPLEYQPEPPPGAKLVPEPGEVSPVPARTQGVPQNIPGQPPLEPAPEPESPGMLERATDWLGERAEEAGGRPGWFERTMGGAAGIPQQGGQGQVAEQQPAPQPTFEEYAEQVRTHWAVPRAQRTREWAKEFAAFLRENPSLAYDPEIDALKKEASRILRHGK